MKISTRTLTMPNIHFILADEMINSLTRIKNIPISCNLRCFKQNCKLNCVVNKQYCKLIKMSIF